MDRAAAGPDALDDDELATRLDIGLWVGWTEAVLERHEQAVEHCQRVIDVSRATGQGATLLVTMTAQAWALMRAGACRRRPPRSRAPWRSARWPRASSSRSPSAYRRRSPPTGGDYEAAIRAGEESVRLVASADHGLIPGMSGLYLATPLIEMAQARRAREVLLVASDGRPQLATSRSGHCAAFEVLTRAEVSLGRLDQAEFWARRAEAASHGGALAAESAFARRATAVVALARDDAARAAQIPREAADRAVAAGAPGEGGRCRILLARALVQAGDRARALEALEQAVRELGAIGAHGYREEAQKEAHQGEPAHRRRGRQRCERLAGLGGRRRQRRRP